MEKLHLFRKVVGEESELKDDADQEAQDHAEEVVVFEDVEVEADKQEEKSEDDGVEDASEDVGVGFVFFGSLLAMVFRFYLNHVYNKVAEGVKF